MVLHQGEPLKIIVAGRGFVEKLVCLALENPEDAAFLFRPGTLVDIEIFEISGERRVERPIGHALPAKGPVGIGRVCNQLQELFPGRYS